MTFSEWLTKQKRRNDLVGDIARDAAADPTFPRSGSKAVHERYFDPLPDPVRFAFGHAWSEYEQEVAAATD